MFFKENIKAYIKYHFVFLHIVELHSALVDGVGGVELGEHLSCGILDLAPHGRELAHRVRVLLVVAHHARVVFQIISVQFDVSCRKVRIFKRVFSTSAK